MTKFAITAALAASLSFLAVAPAAAEDMVVRVDYSDLDLSTPAGTEVLGKRIEANAETACERPDVRDLKGMVAFEKCKDQVVTGAVEQMAAKGVALTAAN